MSTSYKVRVWAIEPRKNKQGKATSYRIRWEVDGKDFRETFKLSAQADSFRADLLSAQRKGEAFNTETGLPVSMTRETKTMTWFDFACSFAGMKWPDAAPKYRKSIAESLTRVTVAMLNHGKPLPDGKVLRKALMTAFTTNGRDGNVTPEITEAIKAAACASMNVADLANPDVLRSVLRALDRNLDGGKAAANTVRLRRVALGDAINYAMEKKLLTANPLTEVKTKKRKTMLKEVEPECVVNPMQGRMLLDAVGHVGKQGPPLVAFFGTMYYSALRPEEAANLKKNDLVLPPPGRNEDTGEEECGWGDLHLKNARPEIGEEWTDSGETSEERSLKHREDNIGRTVPCPPELTKLLHHHLETFGTAPDGRLFRGARNGGRIGSTTYGRVWARAREAVFTAEVVASPLGKRPYDLRHAAVSTWLNGGVEPTRVAKWAGHSLAVLLKVYAKCLSGGEKTARDRVAQALRGW